VSEAGRTAGKLPTPRTRTIRIHSLFLLAAFYRWLWESPPPGVGLSGYAHIDTMTIIRMLEKTRDEMQQKNRAPINALIEDLKGNGAAKPRGGDRRSENAKQIKTPRPEN
jgi:hypothetical protein